MSSRGARRWLSLDEFCVLAGAAVGRDIPTHRVRRWLRSGKLRGRKLLGGHWQVLATEVERLAENPPMTTAARRPRSDAGELVCEVQSRVFAGKHVVVVERAGGELCVGHARPGRVPSTNPVQIDQAAAQRYLELAVRTGRAHTRTAGEWARGWSRNYYAER